MEPSFKLGFFLTSLTVFFKNFAYSRSWRTEGNIWSWYIVAGEGTNLRFMKNHEYSCSVRRGSCNSFTLQSPGETAGALCTICWVDFGEDADNGEMPKENRENNCRS